MIDGGPAFPVPGEKSLDGAYMVSYPTPGISVRDYFAAAALQGILANEPYMSSMAATVAYGVADAMIAQRAV